MRDRALQYLRKAIGSPEGDFRPGQWESIDGLLKRRRLLVVERTGWGKSMIYFLATRLLRDQGTGITLLVSPLLALMRNQLAAAARIGLRAETINSTNPDRWAGIERRLQNDEIDILLVSPERLANQDFRGNVLAPIASRIGLFVVDEAHCISDWGHDFRPDYRRIADVLQAIPSNVPVLATTATANNRVVEDVSAQLGAGVEVVRGPLVRESLLLQNITLPSPAARMAWLATTVPRLPGSGIIYTLTQRDAERVSLWLQRNGIGADAYHADIDDPQNGPSAREELEQKLLDNKLKVLVATVALGMGFDKPDLGFVIHFQRPGSVVHYYQQVGRAGRAVDKAFGVLLHGEEDDHIVDYFIRNAFPPQAHVQEILTVMENSEGGLSTADLQSRANLSKTAVEKSLKYMSVESPSPITRIGSKWHVTPAATGYRVDQARVAAISQIRRQEQEQMRSYMRHDGCLMEFLGRALDDPDAHRCGKCAGCTRKPLLPIQFDRDLANQAAVFLRRSYQRIEPRKRWPSGNPLPIYGLGGSISEEFGAAEGSALCLWRDAGWGELVADGKYETGSFDDELVTACVDMISVWKPTPAPEWVACIPSLQHPRLVPDFATRLAAALAIPFIPCLNKVRPNRPQKEMQNSFHQTRNLDGVFEVVTGSIPSRPCLLVDDVVDSRWTFTVAAAILRRAGCPAVYPLALALNSPRID